MDLEIKNYIDFNNLFLELLDLKDDELNHHKYEAQHYNQILEFRDIYYDDYKLITDECDYDYKTITFFFEKIERKSTNVFIIVYDCFLDEFVSCDFEN